MRLDVRHLELVLAIAEAGSLRKAAARLHLTQSAVTTQLKRIEQHLGGELFVRLPDGVLPTRAGVQFIRDARRVLGDIEGLTRSARRTLSHGAGAPVRVGGIPAQQFSLLVEALGAVLPDREVTSRTVRGTGVLTALLGSGELDVAVMRRFPGFPLTLPPDVAHRLLLTEPIFVGVAQGHRLAAQRPVPLAETAGEHWVMPHPDDSGMNDFVTVTCARAGFTQQVSHLTDEAHVAHALTAQGGAVCPLYPLGAARTGLATLPLTGNPLFRDLVLAWRTDSVTVPFTDELCARMARGYLALVENDAVYAQWWNQGGAEFALP